MIYMHIVSANIYKHKHRLSLAAQFLSASEVVVSETIDVVRGEATKCMILPPIHDHPRTSMNINCYW